MYTEVWEGMKEFVQLFFVWQCNTERDLLKKRFTQMLVYNNVCGWSLLQETPPTSRHCRTCRGWWPWLVLPLTQVFNPSSPLPPSITPPTSNHLFIIIRLLLCIYIHSYTFRYTFYCTFRHRVYCTFWYIYIFPWFVIV